MLGYLSIAVMHPTHRVDEDEPIGHGYIRADGHSRHPLTATVAAAAKGVL